MLIQCTSCGTQAKVPDNMQGSKVKCPACGHVYVARERGRGGRARSSQSSDPTQMLIIGGAVAAALVIGFFAIRGGGTDDKPVNAASTKKETAEAPEPVKEYIPAKDFRGPAAQFVKGLHMAASGRNRARLENTMNPALAYAAWTETHPAESGAHPTWEEMDEDARAAAVDAILDDVLTGLPDGFVAGWTPFAADEAAFDARPNEVTVRLNIEAIDPEAGLPDRWITWTLHPEGEDEFTWVGYGGQYAKTEKQAKRAEQLAQIKAGRPAKKTLSTGQEVRESLPRPIAYDADVDEATRSELSGLVATLVDPETGNKDLARTADTLEEAGKPAVAPLLTALYEQSQAPEGIERTRNIFQISRILNGITGDDRTTIAMQVSDEEMESGIKQWFAWYDAKYKRFKGKAKAEERPIDIEDMTREERVKYELEQANKKKDK